MEKQCIAPAPNNRMEDNIKINCRLGSQQVHSGSHTEDGSNTDVCCVGVAKTLAAL
jgi:hypothetical protein